MAVIDRFTGEYEFLSNFSLYPVFNCDTVEHWYQMMKTTDLRMRENVRMCATPGEAKKVGRNLRLRKDWESIRLTVMRMAIIEKFSPGTDAAEELLLTGRDILVEGNYWHDNFWGDCTCSGCEEITGSNELGFILMKQRRRLRRI